MKIASSWLLARICRLLYISTARTNLRSWWCSS